MTETFKTVRPVKAQVRLLWRVGKSVAEIEKALGIEIRLGTVGIGELHRVLVNGEFDFQALSEEK